MFVAKLQQYDDDFHTLYDCDGRYGHLAPGDVAVVRQEDKDDIFIQVTHRHQTTVKELLKERPHLSSHIEKQVGRKLEKSDLIDIVEFRKTHEYLFDPKK